MLVPAALCRGLFFLATFDLHAIYSQWCEDFEEDSKASNPRNFWSAIFQDQKYIPTNNRLSEQILNYTILYSRFRFQSDRSYRQRALWNADLYPRISGIGYSGRWGHPVVYCWAVSGMSTCSKIYCRDVTVCHLLSLVRVAKSAWRLFEGGWISHVWSLAWVLFFDVLRSR